VLAAPVETFKTLEEMVYLSDAVVVGRYADMRPTRVFGDPSVENAAYYVEGTLVVEEILYVNPELQASLSDRLRVESVTFERYEVDGLVANYPRERAVYFLRNNATTARMAERPVPEQTEEAAYWHVVTGDGVLRDFGGKTSPLTSHTQYLAALAEVPFDDVLATLRELAATPQAGN
jgi:hypothetical protein